MKKRFRDTLLPRLQRYRGELISLVQWTREKGTHVVDSAADPILFAGFFLFSWLAYDTYSGLGELAGNEADRALEWLKFYAYLVGGVVLIWQVRISNRRVASMEETVVLGEKRDITEQFKNAIEHLGGDKLSVRMGGIYTLRNIALESAEYASVVAKILCAHLREMTTAPEYNQSKKPTTEAIAVLDVLFCKHIDPTAQWALGWGIDISGAVLNKANLSNRNMMGMNADGVQFNFADLSYSWFLEASLVNTNFVGAILRESSFYEATLIGTVFSHAKMGKANFYIARIIGANFSDADMTEVDFSHVRQLLIPDVDAPKAREFSRGKFRIGLVFRRAICVKTNFEGADLSDADFLDADMSGSRLEKATVTAEQLLKAKTLYGAELDDHIREEIMRRKPELLSPPTKKRPVEEEE